MADQNSSLVKTLSFENHPLNVFLYRGKIAFLTREVGEILGISRPTNSLSASKALEDGTDYTTIPAVSLGVSTKNVLTSNNPVSILYLSGFFLFVLRSNKPIAIPFTRWTIREAIPLAMAKREPPKVTTEDIKLMELHAKHKNAFARQVLIERGFIENPDNKQLSFDDAGNTDGQNPSGGGGHGN